MYLIKNKEFYYSLCTTYRNEAFSISDNFVLCTHQYLHPLYNPFQLWGGPFPKPKSLHRLHILDNNMNIKKHRQDPWSWDCPHRTFGHLLLVYVSSVTFVYVFEFSSILINTLILGTALLYRSLLCSSDNV